MKKRRLLSIVFSLCMALMFVPQMVFAGSSGTTSDGLKYTISDDGKVTITGYEGSGSSVSIPEQIEGYDVTAIDTEDIGITSSVTNISIPSSVTFIRSSSFGEWENLKEITVSEDNLHYSSNDGVLFNKDKTILLLCPKGYTDNSYVIPNSVASIGQDAFSKCKILKNITIPDSVTSIGTGAFSECRSLESITIPDGVTSIGNKAFYYCVVLKSITIPDSVTSIGTGAFYDCEGLESIDIPDGVTIIGERAFSYCKSLESIDIPDGVTSIENATFYSCEKLASVNIPNGITSIGKWAFEYCKSLKSIEIPSSVTSIGINAFDGCTSLESIFLPDDLDASEAKIPDATSQVKYSLDTNKDAVTITGITLGTGKNSVAIPDTICGYPVVAISNASLLEKITSHTCAGGEATCQKKAVCGICKQEYGEKKPDNHIGTKVWETTETQHKQHWDCCNAVVVAYENHTWNNGVCSECDYVCKHTGGTEIQDAKNATCAEKGYSGDEYCLVCNKMITEGHDTNMVSHKLNPIPKTDATVTETGNNEYWQCQVCDKYFSDADGVYEISDLEAWKTGDGKIDKLPPEIIKGKGQSITAGEKKALSFTSNAAFDDFKRVELDGSELSVEYYEKAEGSIIITLDADYVATLPVGEHTIGIVSESGTAETTFTVAKKVATGTTDDSDKDSKSDEDSVKTGDNANLALWLALMLLSGAGITGVTAYTRRKRTNE
ncbi:MAG: leucine-rich repeat domain-containing protein [Lachnospiraceae bacterium]